VPNYGFQCEGRPRAGSSQELKIGIFCFFWPSEVICRPAPTLISKIRISGVQIFLFYTNCEKKLFGHSRKKKIFFALNTENFGFFLGSKIEIFK
jgi:hypothetical protein